MACILSHKELIRHAEDLIREMLEHRRATDPYTIIVGHGYGGLICEQVYLGLPISQRHPVRILTPKTQATVIFDDSLWESPPEDSRNGVHGSVLIDGIVLIDTPHFRAGIGQWAILSAKRKNIACAENARHQDWSKYTKDIVGIASMQDDFCSSYTKYPRRTRIACCYRDARGRREDHVSELLIMTAGRFKP
jgi:pimeloyl-ACP methyl ester carboxylesterase